MSKVCATFEQKQTPIAVRGIMFSFPPFDAEAEGVEKRSKIDGDTSPPEEASSSGLNNGTATVTSEETAEAAISQSDSENKDPSSNSQPEEFYKSKRGRPSKHFLRNKYKKYINRK